MELFKKHKLKLTLAVIIFIAAVMCVISIVNYKGIGTNSNNTNQFGMNAAQGSRGRGPGGFDGQLAMGQNRQTPPANANPHNSGTNSTNPSTTRNKNSNITTNKSAPENNNQNRGDGFQGQGGPGNFNGGFGGNHSQNTSNGSVKGNGSNTKISSGLLLYGAVFLLGAIITSILAIKRKLKGIVENKKIILILFLAIGFLIRLWAATLMNGHNDINLFKNWAESAAKSFTTLYSSGGNIDYPPFYLYVLCGIGKLASIASMNKYFIILLKLPSIIADIVSSYLIYKFGQKMSKPLLGLFMSIFYLLNPAVLINSTFWGQVDSVFTMLLLIALYFMVENKMILSSMLFTMAVLMKPQGIIFLPILFFHLLIRKDVKAFVKAIITALATTALVILPFSINNGITWVYKLYVGTVNEYPYASVNAFNFYSLLNANFKQDSLKLGPITYHNLGMLFIVLITILCGVIYIKGRNKNIGFGYAAALLLISGVFTFSSSMHERYLFPAVALSLFAFLQTSDIRIMLLSIGYTVTSFINTYYVLFQLSGGNAVPYNLTMIGTSLLNIVLFIYLAKVLINLAIGNKPLKSRNNLLND